MAQLLFYIHMESLQPKERDLNLAVKEKDPFSLDNEWRTFVDKNIRRSQIWSESKLCEINDGISKLDGSDYSITRAAVRDIDFLLSSLAVTRERVIDDYPAIEDFLLRVSLEHGILPRGSVYTYAIQNPEGDRLRTYTGTDEEKQFIDAVRRSGEALEEPTLSLVTSLSSPDNDKLMNTLDDLLIATEQLKNSMRKVMKVVSPEFFTSQLRPFFNPYYVGSEKLLGPGGAQLQVSLLDRLIHGDADPQLEAFLKESIRYLEPQHIDAYRTHIENGDATLLQLVEEGFINEENQRKINEVLISMERFRRPHLSLANANFELRSEYDVGSGGYRPEILESLLKRNSAGIMGRDV